MFNPILAFRWYMESGLGGLMDVVINLLLFALAIVVILWLINLFRKDRL